MLTGLSMMASSARPDDDDDSTTPSGGGGGGGGGGGDECHCWVSGYCRVLPGYMKGPPVGHRWRRCSDRGRGRGPKWRWRQGDTFSALTYCAAALA